jgi:hypothetical protein
MKKIILFTYLISISGFAQQVAVSGSSNIIINSGTFLNVFGLEMNPSSTFVIKDNAINLSGSRVIVSEGKLSISRVYNMSNPLSGYSGPLSLSYEDIELNGENESKLNIEIKNNGTWTKYAPLAINQSLNKITLGGTLTNKTMDKVTAAIGLFDLAEVIIYPNPTASTITIKSDKPLQVQIYNSIGQKITETNSLVIDMSHFSTGMYLLRLKHLKSNKSNVYKIFKK